jgi:hypothetical protein
MDFKQTKAALDSFAKFVIKQSRTNLTKKKKNVTSSLYESLGYDLNVSKNSFYLEFYMDEYGAFVDEGVKGKKSNYPENRNSRFSFNTKRPPMQPLADWAQKKNIRLRDKKGKFTKGNYKTIAHIIAGNIYNRGIKPSLFFTKPFEKAFKNIDKDLIKAYRLDIETLMENSINNK